MPPKTKNPNLNQNHEQMSEKFKARYDDIINTPLKPETIDTYADDALNQMVDLIDDALTQSPLYGPWQTQSNHEKQVLADFGLPEVETSLDNIDQISKDISEIGKIVETSKQNPVGTVLVPPNSHNPNLAPGNGSFQKPGEVPRTKTVAFILQQDFGVDLKDPDQFKITSGALTKKMMRDVSYDMIEAPELERLILSCDEERNASFVLDSSRLKHHGLTPRQVQNLSKLDIQQLISQDKDLGQRMLYSKHFIALMKAAIEVPSRILDYDDLVRIQNANKYLKYQIAPPGIMSTINAAKYLGVGRNTFVKYLNIHRGELGEIKKYKFGTAIIAEGFTLEQVKQIGEYIHQIEKAPEGIMSSQEAANYLGVNRRTFVKYLDIHRGEMGEIKKYKFGTIIAEGFTLEQVKQIGEYIPRAEKAPEGIMSSQEAADYLEVSRPTFVRYRKQHPEIEAEQYWFGLKINEGFTLEQVEKIGEYIHQIEKAPEGIMSANMAADYLEVSNDTFIKYRKQHPEIEAKQYRFGKNIVEGFTLEQVEKIGEYIKAGKLARRAASRAA